MDRVWSRDNDGVVKAAAFAARDERAPPDAIIMFALSRRYATLGANAAIGVQSLHATRNSFGFLASSAPWLAMSAYYRFRSFGGPEVSIPRQSRGL
jgi:hypothetical protein